MAFSRYDRHQACPLRAYSFPLVMIFLGFATLMDLESPIQAQEFKLDSQIYTTGQSSPISNSLTLFQNGVVYDIVHDTADGKTPVEIVVYDSRNKSFELIDLIKQHRLHLEQFELVRLVENLRQQGLKDPKLVSLVRPELAEDVDLKAHKITMYNPTIRYEADCMKLNDTSLLPIYFEFLDQCSRLAATDPRRLPPFSRLELNQALKKYNLMPTEIRLTLKGGQLHERDLSLTSKHTLINNLSAQDRERIEMVKKSWMQYKQVELSVYREIPQIANDSGNTSKR